MISAAARTITYGVAAGTDTHTAFAAAEGDNFFAKFPVMEPRSDRGDEDAQKQAGQPTSIKGWQVSSAGSTALWAVVSTRAELWYAMKRKETCATSGTEKVGKDGVITVEEAKGTETNLEVVEGMQYDRATPRRTS